MKVRSGQKIKLTTIEELLGVPKEEMATEIDLVKIKSFKNHPFKVIHDEQMEDLIESIKVNGILTPVLVRPVEDGMYEMVSGHRRMHAASLLKKELIPAIVREMSDEDAILAMVDSNIQREELLYSEKAFAYKMKLDVMKYKVGRPEKNSSQSGTNLKRSDQELAEQVGESKNTIHRYIRLTELIPEILNLVDLKRISFMVAVDISYLDKEIQKWLFDYICANGNVTPQQIKEIRKYLQTDKMNQLTMVRILNSCLMPKKTRRKITLSERKINQYFGNEYTQEQVEEILTGLLKRWKIENLK